MLTRTRYKFQPAPSRARPDRNRTKPPRLETSPASPTPVQMLECLFSLILLGINHIRWKVV
ncbi:uncharacterized protein BJ212DRAFT_1400523 [Suillus subaureus]|uniref:Uncharacterized protein n=1 Tax=Suillus subaureus TaxID=48587 RepID=A0A9P7DQF2_9AGAM|nr:uncharacterized protein BJ212DRAFT_1400523 [Suillus subaureus]KAG1800510.1 hypothetical protein BJ212DRAFT_1400523 [Suillus subaureus]